VRLAGADRYGTGVSTSRSSFPQAGSAEAVVLARGDDPFGFADALSGTPLAVAVGGPVLITRPDELVEEVRAEIQRVLTPGRTVYLLGGERALSAAIETEIRSLGYVTERLWGETRYDTALRVAAVLGDRGVVLVTTGSDFPDALAAGAAAAHVGGVVLLTPSEQRWPGVDAYLRAHPTAAAYAVGGPAARPYQEATAVYGGDRFETATRVAARFFDAPTHVGLARSDRFPDSLSGGAHVGRLGGPLLLTPTDTLNSAFTARYLCDHAATIGDAVLYGGTAAISDAVRAQVADRVAGRGCV
jgi:hypothetical protein